MRKLLKQLKPKCSHGVRLTMYQDDIILWPEPEDHSTTELAVEAVQVTLDKMTDYLKTMGTKPSLERRST